MAQIKLNMTYGATGTLPAVSGANLTSLTSGNLTGALPAISGASLTSLTSKTDTYFCALMTVNQSVTNNTITKVSLNNVEYDTLGSWDSTNLRWISTTTGKYFVYGMVNCYNGSASQMAIVSTMIRKNGSNLFVSHLDFRNNYGGYYNGVGVGGIVNMGATSDYIELWGYPYANSASSVGFRGNSSGVTTNLAIFRIS